MKIRILFSLFGLMLVAILFLNASQGAAEVQEQDRTMSPLSNSTSCATCHNSGSFSPSLNVQLLDGEMGVTTYEPGKTYTLRVEIANAEAANVYGFQTVMLQGEADANAGTFGTPAAGIQVTPLAEHMYAEHSTPSNSNIFMIDWTAPAEGLGDIRIYASGNAANDNGSISGDNGVFLASPVVLTQAGTSNSKDRILTFDAIRISPNPTYSGAMLNLENSQPGRYSLSLFNAVGQNILRKSLDLVQGAQSHWIDLSEQPKGLYFLQLSNGQQLLTRKILKQ